MKLHVVQGPLVVFQGIKFIDGCKKLLKIRHFIFKTKSRAPTVTMSFDCKVKVTQVTTPTVMHSGHRYKASGSLNTQKFYKGVFNSN